MKTNGLLATVLLMFTVGVFAQTPDATRPNAQPKPATAKVPTSWKRMVLTGTGISVASPIPYTLYNDKPDQFNVDSEAEVMWRLEDGDLYGYVAYNKINMGYRSLRNHLQEAAEYQFGKVKAMDEIVLDTTLMGEPAAFFSEEKFDQGRNKMMRVKMAVIGKPNDYQAIYFSFPADDKVAAEKSSQIIQSLKREGSLATPQPKFPAPNWRTFDVEGLLFEFPSGVTTALCNTAPFDRTKNYCGSWGTKANVTFTIYYSTFQTAGVRQLVSDSIKDTSELVAKSGEKYEPVLSAFPINNGEAMRVTDVGITTAEKIYIRRGNGYWRILVTYSDSVTANQAVKRIMSSVKFKS